MSATTDSALGLSEERGVRGDGGRPGGEAGAGWGGGGRTHGPARLAGQTFVWRGKKRTSRAKFSAAGPSSRTTPRTHTPLPPSRARLDVPSALNSSTSALWPTAQARQPRPTRFAVRTAPVNRERQRSIREEVSTSRPSPLASTRRRAEVSDRRRGALQRPSPTAQARQPRPDSRPELHRLTGKGKEVSGRR